jgi:hypothetical protein
LSRGERALQLVAWLNCRLSSAIPFRESESAVSKKTKKRKLKARRNRANHGKKPNAGRRS